MLKWLLFPISILFGLGIRLRHLLFDLGVLPEKSFDIPTIGIGNLCMGGAGKTPQTEFLVKLLLKESLHIAILSRGYGRKTKGFFLAGDNTTSDEIGDEPMQYLKKFGKRIQIAVDESRVDGMKNLIKMDNSPDLVLLDDVMQHRYIKPGLMILLTDYRELYVDDHLFPIGHLRDVKSSAKRADIIIVTKTDKILSPIIRRTIYKKLNPQSHQQIYFSYVKYGKLVSLHNFEKTEIEKKYSAIFLLTGIANPYPLKDHLRYYCRDLIAMEYADHHVFNKRDIQILVKTFKDHYSRKKIIITTEKDAMRLLNSPYLRLLKGLPVYFLPIEVKFHGKDQTLFNQQILHYVRENKRNR